jgi:hypothetical protein
MAEKVQKGPTNIPLELAPASEDFPISMLFLALRRERLENGKFPQH